MSLVPPGYGEADWRNQASRLWALRNLGFEPKRVLDIGAHHGFWGGLAAHVWPAAQVLSVEANEDCRSELEKRGRPFEIALLSDKEEEVPYFKCETGTGEGNGLFRENSVHPFQETRVRTRRLDELAAGRVFDFIKLDCQGGERRVLDGGDETVRKAHIVQLETQIQDYNEGAPRMADLISDMAYWGFRLYDIVDFHHNSRGMLIQTDLLFAKESSPLFQIRPLS